jgi:uncharacterized membrane protein YhaH (DUF805 family)
MNRHSVDIFSLGAGLAFLVIAVAFMVEDQVSWGINGAIVFPLLLVVLGALGIWAAVRAQRSNDAELRAAEDDSED